MKSVACALAALILLGAAAPAGAETGSGTVSFEFLNFYGPFGDATFGDPTDPTTWGGVSGFNGQFSQGSYGDGTPIFSDISTSPNGLLTGQAGNLPSLNGIGARSFTVAPDGTLTTGPSSVTFTEANPTMLFPNTNVLSFASDGFTDVAKGTPFTLGTLTFKNGAWWGTGATSAQNAPSLFGFKVTTQSGDGDAFNQTDYGLIRLVTNSTTLDRTTLAGQEAEADWITVYTFGQDETAFESAFDCFKGTACDGQAGLGTFRVFDSFAQPAGYTSTGTIDITAEFNSLDLLDLANPTNGFLTAGNAPLMPGVPEPGTWAMLLAGFGAIGLAMRRSARKRLTVA